MVDWVKKVQKTCSGDIGSENVTGALFVQPSGSMASAIGMGVGGVVGSIVAEAAHTDLSTSDGVAAQIPSKNVVLALTPTRLLVFGHSQLSGKPKGLEATIPVARVKDMALEPGKVSSKLAVVFEDDSVKVFDAPKLGNPEAFVSAFQARR